MDRLQLSHRGLSSIPSFYYKSLEARQKLSHYVLMDLSYNKLAAFTEKGQLEFIKEREREFTTQKWFLRFEIKRPLKGF